MKKWINISLSSASITHVIITFGFVFLSLLFYYPLLSGKILLQSDIRQYDGMSRQLKDFRVNTESETYWIDNAFGGMPTYQLGAKYPVDILSPIYSFFRIIPRPAHILFLYLLGAYLLLIIIKMPWPIALFGAISFGFSTYLLIILQVGHNTKALAVSFFPFVIAGMLLLFKKRWLWGILLSCLAIGMQIRANHYQMSYYLLMLMGVFVLIYGYHAVRNKNRRSFLKSFIGLTAAGIIALGFNATPLLATAEYAQFSTRGASELKLSANGSPKEQSSGLDYEYITEYSYGIFESLNLIAPRIQGGGSSEDLGSDYGIYDFLIKNGVGVDQASQFSKNVPTYWGDQPILEAPAYIGITVFFFALFGFFFTKGPLRNSLLLGTLFSLLLSWGKNMPFITDLLIDYFPFYNKFRAVSSIQVVLEFCLPISASIGLYNLFYKEKKFDFKRFIKIAVIPIILLVIIFLSKGMLSFSGLNDSYLREIYGSDLFSQIKEARVSVFQADILRGILFCAVLIIIINLYEFNRIKRGLALGFVIFILSLDLLSIANRYIDRGAFVSSRLASKPFNVTAADLAIQKDNSRFRVFEPQLGLTGGRTAYFHNAIGGYHGAKPRRFEELFEVYNTKQNAGILNFLNVKYILFPDKENGNLKPLLNPNALGSVWLVSNLKEVNSADNLIEELNNTNFSDTALILKKDVISNIENKYIKDSLIKIKLAESKPNFLSYTIKNDKPQFAVFSEMYYPYGWKATIDGVEAPIINVNYVLRGLHIPSNSSQIEFRFEPEVIVKGTLLRWISFVIFLIVIITLGYFQYFKKTSKAGWEL